MAKNNKTLVSVKKINKFYGKKHILKDVSLDVNEGDRIALIGGNGSGKSTLVEIISGVKEQTSGKVTRDKDIVVGVQFQESEYPIGITVKALIDFYLNRFSQSITKDDLTKYLHDFRLEDLYKKQIVDLSGGQKQRLNVLLAIIHNPNLLILDELSTGLDIKVRRELRAYVNQYLEDHPKAAMILVTHSVGEISLFAKRLIVLNWGVITEDLSVEAILKKNKSLEAYTDKLFDDMYTDENFAKKGRDS